MNFRDLAQRLVVEAGISGSPGGPSTVAGQVGSLGRAVSSINSTWLDLQLMRDDWTWMRSSVLLGAGASFVTVATQASYPLGTGPGTCGVDPLLLGKWVDTSFRNYTTTVGSQGEIRMDRISFEAWRESYMYGAQTLTQTRPVAVAIGPDNSVCVGPPSNGQYTVTGDFYWAPTQMVADTDVPTRLPTAFHMLIVWQALLDYGSYEAAPEAITRAETHVQRMMPKLLALRGNRIGLGGALA